MGLPKDLFSWHDLRETSRGNRAALMATFWLSVHRARYPMMFTRCQLRRARIMHRVLGLEASHFVGIVRGRVQTREHTSAYSSIAHCE